MTVSDDKRPDRPEPFDCPRCGCKNCRGCYCHEDPFEHLVGEALHLLVNGERAAGGETWAAWASSAEDQLRRTAVVAGWPGANVTPGQRPSCLTPGMIGTRAAQPSAGTDVRASTLLDMTADDPSAVSPS